MKLDDLRKAVIATQADDWHRVDDGGVTYLDTFGEVTSWRGDDEVHWLEHDRHHSRVVLKSDVAIGMAWGLDRQGDSSFWEDWVERYPDGKATAAWLDLLYHGQPVDRRFYVVVDGGRCKIPLPEQIFRGDVSAHEVRRWISYDDYRLFAIVNGIDSGYDYESYLDRSGLDVSREP